MTARVLCVMCCVCLCVVVWSPLPGVVLSCSAQSQGLLCEESGNYMDNVRYCGYCSAHYKKLVGLVGPPLFWNRNVIGARHYK